MDQAGSALSVEEAEKDLDKIRATYNAKLKIKDAHIALLRSENSFHEFIEKAINSLCEQIGLKNGSVQNGPAWHQASRFLRVFTYFHFAYPSHVNERILRQKGAFLVFPPLESKYWTVEEFKKPETINICAKAKSSILKELADFGITELPP